MPFPYTYSEQAKSAPKRAKVNSQGRKPLEEGLLITSPEVGESDSWNPACHNRSLAGFDGSRLIITVSHLLNFFPFLLLRMLLSVALSGLFRLLGLPGACAPGY